MEEGLRALGLGLADSQANFCWVHLGEQTDEAEVVDGLRERGVLVRAGAALGADEPALRVTYGLPEENARFLAALGEVLAHGRPLSRCARALPPESGTLACTLDRRVNVC